MIWLEIIGTIFAASGFTMLSYGRLKVGFIMGLVSCCLLIPLFVEKNLIYMLILQSFFAIININGIYRNKL